MTMDNDSQQLLVELLVSIPLILLAGLVAILVAAQNTHETRMACIQAGLEFTQVGKRLECKP